MMDFLHSYFSFMLSDFELSFLIIVFFLIFSFGLFMLISSLNNAWILNTTWIVVSILFHINFFFYSTISKTDVIKITSIVSKYEAIEVIKDDYISYSNKINTLLKNISLEKRMTYFDLIYLNYNINQILNYIEYDKKVLLYDKSLLKLNISN